MKFRERDYYSNLSEKDKERGMLERDKGRKEGIAVVLGHTRGGQRERVREKKRGSWLKGKKKSE